MKSWSKQLEEKLALQCSPEYAHAGFFRALARLINHNSPWIHIGFELYRFKGGFEIKCEHEDVDFPLVYTTDDHANPKYAAEHDLHILNNLEEFLL